jgi:cytochrome c oxidase subunit 1
VFANWMHSLMRGTKAPQNPWHADTLEWTHTSTPPIEHNFHEQPVVTHGPYRYESVESDMAKAKI